MKTKYCVSKLIKLTIQFQWPLISEIMKGLPFFGGWGDSDGQYEKKISIVFVYVHGLQIHSKKQTKKNKQKKLNCFLAVSLSNYYSISC